MLLNILMKEKEKEKQDLPMNRPFKNEKDYYHLYASVSIDRLVRVEHAAELPINGRHDGISQRPQPDYRADGGGENPLQGADQTLRGQEAGDGILQIPPGEIQDPCESGVDDRIGILRTVQEEKTIK